MKNHLGRNTPTPLRVAIARAGLTQAALADLAGVSEYVLSGYSTGRTTPGIKAAKKLIAALATCGVAITLEELCVLPYTPTNKENTTMNTPSTPHHEEPQS